MSTVVNSNSVFLSYAHEDAEAVQRIAAGLSAAGIQVWFDKDGLRVGDAWDQKIRTQIKQCALFIPIISANTERRVEGYFRFEWRLSVERTHLMAEGLPFIAPVVIDDTSESAALVPDAFSHVQWTRLIRGEPSKEFIAHIGDLLAQRNSPIHSNKHDYTSATKEWKHPHITRTTDKSIVVLPFVNLSDEAGSEYFTDGISEDLIGTLSHIHNLKVIARTSAFSFKKKNMDVREIGRILDVNHVLEGSVRRVGSALRVTTQLVNTFDGSQLWSARYDRTVADSFTIQDEIANSITQAVGGILLSGGPRFVTDEETYDLFLQGRAMLSESMTLFDEAAEILTQVIARDPGFIPAMATLGGIHFLLSLSNAKSWKIAQTYTTEVATRAPDSAEAERLLGFMASAKRDFASAESHLKRSLEMNPNDGLTHAMFALVLLANGKKSESALHNNRIVALDPLSPISHAWASNNLAAAGDYIAAEVMAAKTISLDPRYPEGYHMRGYALNYLGRFQEAYDDLVRVPSLGNTTAWPLAKRAISLTGLGRFAEVRELLEEMLRRRESEFVRSDAIACMYQLISDNDEAFRWLAKAIEEEGFSWLPYIGIDPLFAVLRKDARFETFCRMNRIPIQPLVHSAMDSLQVPANV